MKKIKNKRWKVVKNKYCLDRYDVYRLNPNKTLKQGFFVFLGFALSIGLGISVYMALEGAAFLCILVFVAAFFGTMVTADITSEFDTSEYTARSLDEAFEWIAEKELETLEQTEWYV